MLLRLLALYLAVWEPLTLALFVAPRLSAIGLRGYAAAAFLFFRVLVAALGIAAGLALWRGAPHARGLALAALGFSTVASLATLLTRLLPTSLPPGDEWFWAGVVVSVNAAAATLLTRSFPRACWRR